jgi:DNA-binding IclR family transcriptional regulator
VIYIAISALQIYTIGKWDYVNSGRCLSVAETKYRVPALEKAIQVIQLLCESSSPMNLTEVARQAGTNNNMAYRILQTLQSEGWIIQEQPGPTYRMSLKPFHFTSMPVNRMNLLAAASKPMNAFWQKHGECCYLGVLDDDKVLYLDCLEQVSGPIRISVNRGGRYTLHTSAPGKLLLAHNKEAAENTIKKGLERCTDKTLCKAADFREDLKLTAERGYALDDEEGARGLVCMSVPIFNNETDVVGTFGISVLTANYRSTRAMFEALGKDVIETGRQISSALGCVSS